MTKAKSNQMKTKNYNGKRSNIISSLKRKNIKLVKQIRNETNYLDLSSDEADHLLKFETKITKCSNISLYKETSSKVDFITSHMCDHKACFICNYSRQKKVRRKYMRWFNENEHLIEIEDKKGKRKIITNYQKEHKFQTATVTQKVKYDIMFLTLTVPHSNGKFRGKAFYQKEIRAIFNQMRKTDIWKQWVYGGEFGIEITKRENGLHIHIHSLIFVRKAKQSRNQLHKFILSKWNSLTVDKDAKRDRFNQETKDGIKKSNKLLTDDDILSLNPRGATIINLNTVFNWQNGNKKRIKEFGGDEMMKAVMEAISYHFEPTAFDKSSGEFDLPLLIELLPSLFNLRVYDRFGVLYKETPLSLNDNSYQKELHEVLALKENTEEPKEANPFYFVTNPAYVFHIPEEDHRIVLSNIAKERKLDLNASNTNDALEEMGEIVKLMHTKGWQINISSYLLISL